MTKRALWLRKGSIPVSTGYGVAAWLAWQPRTPFGRWVEFRRHSLKEGRQTTLTQLQRIFDKDVLPYLGKRPIYDIKRSDLLEVLARIKRRKVLTIAEKCRAWFNQLFRYALVTVEGWRRTQQ